MRLRSPEWMWRLTRGLHQRGYGRCARIVKILNYVAHRALLPAEAIVGENLTLEHYALGIVIHPNVTIGDGCRIYHHVTIAGEMCIGASERVVIGNRVVLGVNTVILPRAHQGLTIGDDAVIGAGAVVTQDIPPGAIAIGVPARVTRIRDQEQRSHGPTNGPSSTHEILETHHH